MRDMKSPRGEEIGDMACKSENERKRKKETARKINSERGNRQLEVEIE